MKLLHALSALFLISPLAHAADLPPARPTDVSFRHEVQRAFEKGNDFLHATQNSNGWWSTPEHPSVTALALSALVGEPGAANVRHKKSANVQKGYAFVLGCARPDGGIYVTNLANYNTSIALMALLAARDPKYDATVRRARSFVAGMQADLGERGSMDTPWDGGIGYSHDAGRSDMNNTLTALEALHFSKHLVADKNSGAKGEKDLDWAAAIQFLQHCQNLPGVNTQAWVSADARDRGGFVYDPDTSKAGATTNASGQVALRSYGSISYAGLLSYIYADVKQSDPRVVAVMDWLRAHYSLEENPGLGAQGYFYYLHLMTKALNAAGVDVLETRDGKKIDWRRDVAMQLINRQKADGSWQNDNGRWWEKDPTLVTAYGVLTLEIIYRGM